MRAARANESSGGRQRLLAELTQRVVAALEQLARHREAGGGAAGAFCGLAVVVVVTAAAPRRAQRRLEQRPPQRRRALAAEMPGRAAWVGLMHGDVQPAIADGVTRAGEPARVAELGEDRDRGHLADAELAHQRAAAALAAGITAQLLVDRRELGLEPSIIAIATVICSRAVAGSAWPASHSRPPSVIRCVAAGTRGDRARPGCAAATRRAAPPANAATGPARAGRAGARAGSTIPAVARPSPARADAARRRGRSWRASWCRAAPRSRPARPDAPSPRRAAPPPLRTASPSSPPARPQARAPRSAQGTVARRHGRPAPRAHG